MFGRLIGFCGSRHLIQAAFEQRQLQPIGSLFTTFHIFARQQRPFGFTSINCVNREDGISSEIADGEETVTFSIEEVAEETEEEEKKKDEANWKETMIGKERFKYNSETLKKMNYDAWPYYIERNWWKEGKRMTFWAHWIQLRDIKRREEVAKWGPDRLRYKAMKTNNILPRAIIDEFQDRMNAMPKKAHPNLILSLCQFTGRRRGKLKRFRVNRHIFRQLSDRGEISGIQRGLW